MAQVNTTTCIQYGGVTDRMSENAIAAITDAARVSNAKAWISTWIKMVVTPSGGQILFGLYRAVAVGFKMYLSVGSSGKVSFSMERGNGSVVSIQGDTGVIDGKWHNLVGLTEANTMYLFQNKVQQTATGALIGNANVGTATFMLGALPSSVNFYEGKQTQSAMGVPHTDTKESVVDQLFGPDGNPPDITALSGVAPVAWFEGPGVIPPTLTAHLGVENGHTQGDLTTIEGLTTGDAVLDFPVDVGLPPGGGSGGSVPKLVQPLVPRLITKPSA